MGEVAAFIAGASQRSYRDARAPHPAAAMAHAAAVALADAVRDVGSAAEQVRALEPIGRTGTVAHDETTGCNFFGFQQRR